jgi:hypothetical protein
MYEFGSNEDWVWDGSRNVVQFSAIVNGQRIVCRVSEECIMDHFGNPSTETECMVAAKERFDSITDLAGHLINKGRFEPDGTILIRSSDWR